jgi:hypothetical protein
VTTIDLTDPATHALWREHFETALNGLYADDVTGADRVAQAAVALIQERERAVRRNNGTFKIDEVKP